MDDKKITREYYNNLITDYIEGKKTLKGDHPKEVMEAIYSFFHAGKMLVDHPEIGHIPAEYVENLISTLAQHPQYHPLVADLIDILNDGRGE